MPRCLLVAVILTGLVVGSKASSATAQEPCCHRPVLRASAFLIRGAVRLVTLPIRLIRCHHGCHHGCGCYCYGGCHGDCYGPAYGPGYGMYSTESELPGLYAAANTTEADAWPARPAAIYLPLVSADEIEMLSADERQSLAEQAISRGIGLYRQAELEVAGQYFAEATVLAPEMAAAWGCRGVTAAATNDDQLAAECAAQVREFSSTDATARAQLYRRMSSIQGESRAAFEQLVRSASERISTENIAQLP